MRKDLLQSKNVSPVSAIIKSMRTAEEYEVTAYRNLAKKCDGPAWWPRLLSLMHTQTLRPEGESVFAARNAIDGVIC